MAARIRKGDTVEVLAGKSKGSRGTVLTVHSGGKKLTVENVNVVKKHQKPVGQVRAGGIIEKPAPINASNVSLVHNGERTRVGFRVVDGKKVRWSRKHDEAIDG
jgi:large subunit ribosomal protein L24